MTLQELIDKLSECDPSTILGRGFDNPHSYRGDYTAIAFEPALNVSIGKMLKCAEESINRSFCGWKGGEFVMYPETEVYLAVMGDASEDNQLVTFEKLEKILSTKLPYNPDFEKNLSEALFSMSLSLAQITESDAFIAFMRRKQEAKDSLRWRYDPLDLMKYFHFFSLTNMRSNLSKTLKRMADWIEPGN
jgi:hypothetical protein